MNASEKIYDITEDMLSELRNTISVFMSEKRLRHTLAVEREAVEIGKIYAPDKILLLRAAALLHDLTKEFTFEKQLQICAKFDIIVSNIDLHMPKIFHSMTAAAIIPYDFPMFAHPQIISAVRWHTVGNENMEICDRIIYLADYIEETRTFDSCLKLRQYYKDGVEHCLRSGSKSNLELHFIRTLVISFDMTLNELIGDRKMIHPNLITARNALLSEEASMQKSNN